MPGLCTNGRESLTLLPQAALLPAPPPRPPGSRPPCSLLVPAHLLHVLPWLEWWRNSPQVWVELEASIWSLGALGLKEDMTLEKHEPTEVCPMQVRDLRSQHLRADQWNSIVWAQDQGNLQTLPQGRALTSPMEAPLQLRDRGFISWSSWVLPKFTSNLGARYNVTQEGENE